MRRNPETLTSNTLKVGSLTFDTASNKARRDGIDINLRRKEAAILEFLMRNSGRVVTRSMILEHVWDSAVDPITNTVDVHINYLRKKMDKPFNKKLIKTIHSLGYKIEE